MLRCPACDSPCSRELRMPRVRAALGPPRNDLSECGATVDASADHCGACGHASGEPA